MTKHFENPNAAAEAARERWLNHRNSFGERRIKVTCSVCGKTYLTRPKNINPNYGNRYCTDCRRGPNGYRTSFKSELCRGEKNTKAKLTEAKVIAIRRLNANGYNYAYLSRRYNVTKDTIYSVCTRRTWKHVKQLVFFILEGQHGVLQL